MKAISNVFGQLFGPSHNDQFAKLLTQLAETGVECAAHFRKTEGQDLTGIVTFERKADKIVDEIHELLDNSFIMRFDIADAMRLTDEVDDVIDGMRHAASHIDELHAFRPQFAKLGFIDVDVRGGVAHAVNDVVNFIR